MYTGIKDRDRLSFGYSDSIEKVQKEFNYIKKFVESYDDLTDIEKYDLLTHYLYLRYNTGDIIKLVNIKEHCNYTKLVDIPTKMQYIVEHLEDDWSTWKDKNRAILTCATHDTFELSKLTYSYKEILKLINDKVLYPVREYNMRIDDYTEEKEKAQYIKTFTSWIDGDIKVEVDEYASWENRLIIKPNTESIPIMVKYLEETISHEEIFNYIKTSFKKMLYYLGWECCTDEEKELYNEMEEYYNTYFKGKTKIKKRG